MNVLSPRFAKYARRRIAAVLAVMVGLSFGPLAEPQQQADPAQQQSPSPQLLRTSAPQPSQPDANDALPDSPTPVQASAQSTPSGSSQSAANGQQSGDTKPLGTAAAPAEKVTGVTASRPAGAAIAPGKQHRVRSFLIKTGLIVGAGVAVGTVVALSRSSPSRPQ
jgi:hypothetical protein